MATSTTLAQPSSAAGVSSLPCWCGQARWSVSTRGRGFRVLQCASCVSYRNDPPPVEVEDVKSHYDEYYQDFLANTKPLANPATAKHSSLWRVADRFPELYKPGNRALDLGCGNGHLCAELKARGWKWVAGVDVATPRILRARRNYPDLPFYDQFLADTGIPEGSLDLLSMDAVVEHFTDPVASVRDIARYLAPGGRMVLTTPNMDSGSYRFLRGRWTSMLCPHGHVFLYGHRGISSLIQAAGLEVEKTGSYDYPMYTPLEYLKRLGGGDVKGVLWRLHQDIGLVYDRALGEGSALFAIARRPATS